MCIGSSLRISKHDARRSENEYEQLDDKVRMVCYLLHQFGVKTAAACDGHFESRQFFERVWNERARKNMQKGEGNQKRCSAMHSIIYQDKAEGSWKNRYQFMNQTRRKLRKGYLNILIPKQHQWLYKKLRREGYKTQYARILYEGIAKEQKKYSFQVQVQGKTPQRQRSEWRKLTAYFKGCVREGFWGKEA